jgi:hypothetical protein
MIASTALKLHLRVLAVHRRELRIVTLRPQTGVRFSTNRFHDTWHILGDVDAAGLLGRLLWGLAFQRKPGTLIIIDRPHVVATPFEADPGDPIALIPDGLTRIDEDDLRAVKLRLRRAPGPPTTIRWHTFGMPAALDRGRAEHARWEPRRPPSATRERMSRRAGFVCYTAPPDVLRAQAVAIGGMRGSGYAPLADTGGRMDCRFDGEFQVIEGFADRVAAAGLARRALYPGAAGLLAETEPAAAIADRAGALRHERQRERRRRSA